MQTIHIAALAAAAFAVLSWFNIDSSAGSIQSDLRARAQIEVASVLGHTDEIRVEADGRDLTLVGTVADATVIGAVESRIRAVTGVRTVTNLIQIAESRDPEPSAVLLSVVPYRLVVSLTSTGATLDGLVRDEQTRTALLATVRSRPVAGTVRNTLEVEPDTHPQWSEAALDIVRAAVALPSVELHFADHEISIKGRASSPADRDRALAAVRSAVPYGVILQTELTVPISAAVARCEQRFAELQSQRPMVFLSNSTALLPGSQQLLDALAGALQECPATRVEVAGYADSTRDYGVALRLSQSRAEAIEQQLIARGVDGNRLSAVGYGATDAERTESPTGTHMPGPQIALILRGH